VLTPILVNRTVPPVPLSEIAAAFIAQHGSDYERPITNRWIGGLLRRLGVVLYKRNGVFVVLPGQQERIDSLCTRYGIESSPPKSNGEIGT
jgi:hypothetical protein